MFNRRPIGIFLFLIGCNPASVVELDVNLAPFREVLAENVDSAVAVDDFRWGFSGASGVVLGDDSVEERVVLYLDQMALWDVARTENDLHYLATDAGLWVIDRELYETSLNDVLEEPVHSLNAWQGTLWLEGLNQTTVISEEEAFSLSIDGKPVSGPVYEGDKPGEAWVVQDGFHRLRWKDNQSTILESSPTPWAKRGGRSAGGIIWAAQGQEISRRTLGLWERFLLPERAMELWTHPHAEVTWIRGETTWYVWRGNQVQAVEDLPVEATIWDVDSAGRILVSVEGHLERWGTNYSVQVKGLTRDMQVDTELSVQVVPSFKGKVERIEMAMNGAVVESIDGNLTIEPVSLGNGAHELRVTVEYEDEEKIDAYVPFFVGEFGTPTWGDDIYPIFEQYCALCHDGDSESVLNTSDSWRDRIDAILKYIEEGTMPPQNDATWVPVSPEEIATVRAWRATGME